MTPFATEFPVNPIPSRAAFIAQVISWLRGTQYSTVLDHRTDSEIDGESAFLRAEDGEELRLRALEREDDLRAIGFRHDFPDNEGRLWRTEAVLRRNASADGQDLLRLRTQCIALAPGARLESPRKPYLIKSVLRDGWGGRDGALRVGDQPLWLTDGEPGLKLALEVTLGQASRHLPVIYISAVGQLKWLIVRKEIEKLAFDLGGIAHVVVEPNRGFSFRLGGATEGVNAYGGTIAVALPGRGIIRRLYLGWRLPEPRDLLSLLRRTTLDIRSQMPAQGWDWTELQEQALRLQRERDRKRLSVEETEALYEEEIANLKERIEHLGAELLARTSVSGAESDDDTLPASLIEKVGAEIYPGEFADRIRFATRFCLACTGNDDLDMRTRLVLENLSKALRPSTGLMELTDELKRATKDPKRSASQLKTLLIRHGYHEKAGNRHIRLEADDTLYGLNSITIAKTPSDIRGLINIRKQIERTLGISKLK